MTVLRRTRDLWRTRLVAAVRRNGASLTGLALGTVTDVVAVEADWAEGTARYVWLGVIPIAVALPKLREQRRSRSPQPPDDATEQQTVLDADITPGALAVRAPRLRRFARRALHAPAVPMQLPRQKVFHGRTAEIKSLHQELDRQRRAARNGGRRGGQSSAALLLVHGMPGVGKSALAQEFSRQIAAGGYFTGGVLYANLGIAGDETPAADVLEKFVGALGRRPEQIAGNAPARSNQFRSLTRRRRVLIFLDAARSPEQVTQLLPTNPRCLVVVTSRRDFGAALGAKSLELVTSGVSMGPGWAAVLAPLSDLLGVSWA